MTHASYPDEYSLRTATPDDWEAASSALSEAFAEDLQTDADEHERQVFEPERTILAVRGEEIAGVAAAYTRDLTVPGGSVPDGHVTMVGVRPTHRRQGLLTRMMRQQLADVRALGEPLAVLWASEGRIYQRFGYGLAASRLVIDADREVRLRDAPGPGEGRLRSVPKADAVELLAKVYDQVRAERPGWSSRDARWWDHILADPPSRREGRTSLRITVHEGQSGVDGYAMWRTKSEWSDPGPKGTVVVTEVAATNPAAYAALWRLLLDIDLTRHTHYWLAAPDEPLVYLVNEPRRLGAKLQDALWVRLVDVPAALAARRYQAPVDVVLDVTDPLLPDNTGRWHLAAGLESVTCTRTDRPADLALDIHALGSVYLGGVSLGTLAAAGRVAELAAGSLAPASTAFGWHRPPSAPEVF